jgi:hypothetical protein
VTNEEQNFLPSLKIRNAAKYHVVKTNCFHFVKIDTNIKTPELANGRESGGKKFSQTVENLGEKSSSTFAATNNLPNNPL